MYRWIHISVGTHLLLSKVNRLIPNTTRSSGVETVTGMKDRLLLGGLDQVFEWLK